MKLLPLLLAAVFPTITMSAVAKDAAPVTATAAAEAYEARTFTGPDGAILNYRLLRPKNYDAS